MGRELDVEPGIAYGLVPVDELPPPSPEGDTDERVVWFAEDAEDCPALEEDLRNVLRTRAYYLSACIRFRGRWYQCPEAVGQILDIRPGFIYRLVPMDELPSGSESEEEPH